MTSDLKEILADILEILERINNNDTCIKDYINETYNKVKNLEVKEYEK